MEDTEAQAVPDPTETVTLLKSDFELLQKVADFAVADAQALADLLGVVAPEGMAPRQVFYEHSLPRVAALLQTQQAVDVASAEIASKADRFGMKTIDLPDGRQAVKVGQRVEGLLLPPQMLSRRERRRLEREGR